MASILIYIRCISRKAYLWSCSVVKDGWAVLSEMLCQLTQKIWKEYTDTKADLQAFAVGVGNEHLREICMAKDCQNSLSECACRGQREILHFEGIRLEQVESDYRNQKDFFAIVYSLRSIHDSLSQELN